MPSTYSMQGQPHLAIELDAPRIILRSGGNADSDGDPAQLNGKLVLRMSERASIKDIQLVFVGRSKLSYTDGPPAYKSHHLEVPLFFHNFSFLPEHAQRQKDHTHTLNAGVHSFPFSLNLPPDLPGSMRSYSGSASVDYKLKATVIRSGFAAANWTAKKWVPVHRGLGAESMEFNSTVELENTWPGKVMYAFTIPHKAHAAGEEIPVSIRFVPLNKGVRINSIHTEIRENLIIYGKNNSQHNESHAIYASKEELQPGSHGISRAASRAPSAPLTRVSSANNLGAMVSSGDHSPATTSGSQSRNSPRGSSQQLPQAGPSSAGDGGGVAPGDLSRRLAKVKFRPGNADRTFSNITAPTSPERPSPPSLHPRSAETSAQGLQDSNSGFHRRIAETLEPEPEFEGDHEDDLPPDEKHIVLHVKIPRYAAPSNSVPPAIISHRVKWSCLIRNPDGHTSELRCALPLIILDPTFAEEVNLATNGARNLLFGPSGALLPEHEANMIADLPAYENHVQDRIANHSVNAIPSSYQPNPWSEINSRAGSPVNTPGQTRPPSTGHTDGQEGNPDHNPYFPEPSSHVPDAHDVSRRLLSGRSSTSGPDTPNRPLPASSADLASTPGIGISTPQLVSSLSSSNLSSSSGSTNSPAPSSSSHHSRFNLHLPKSAKPRRPFASRHGTGSSSSSALNALGMHYRDEPSTSSQQQQHQHAGAMSVPGTPAQAPSAASTSPTHSYFPSLQQRSASTLAANPNPQNGEGPDYNDVPPYDTAQSWLGGGVVPLSSMRGLPTYEESGSTPNTAPPSRAGSPDQSRVSSPELQTSTSVPAQRIHSAT